LDIYQNVAGHYFFMLFNSFVGNTNSSQMLLSNEWHIVYSHCYCTVPKSSIICSSLLETYVITD